MIYQHICEQVKKLKAKYPDTMDLWELARQMNVVINYFPMGSCPDSVKGFYLYHCRTHVITINSDLPKDIQIIILAHELGHMVLHRNSGMATFRDFSLFDVSSRTEQEANLFAAELLLTNENVVDVLNSDCTFSSAAAQLHVPQEILDFKFRIMKWQGFKLLETPILAKNDFLKNMPIPENHDFDYA